MSSKKPGSMPAYSSRSLVFLQAVCAALDHARASKRLAELPDYLLDDVGITRAEAERCADATWLDVALPAPPHLDGPDRERWPRRAHQARVTRRR